MRVLMLGRPETLQQYGGDRIQIENTALELGKLGVTVDVQTDINADYKKYDIIHVFQLDWNPSCYFYIKQAKKNKIPVVFSPIHHSLKEVERFEKEYAFDLRRITGWLIKNQFHRDVIKDLYRSVLYPKKIPVTAFSIMYGLKKMYKNAINMSDVLLVQTELEAKDLKDTFKVDFKWEKVMNGVGEVFLKPIDKTNPFGLENYLVCVGRIEPRKNQLSIIEAVNKLRQETKLDVQIMFVGAKSKKKHYEYLWKFNKMLEKYNWIHHLDFVPYVNMPVVYKYSKVGISASWFETTGLTSLEALISGANAVASGDRAKEYLCDYAFYCDPGNIDSIKDAIYRAYMAPRPKVPDNFKKDYTWSAAASKTLEVYKSLLVTK